MWISSFHISHCDLGFLYGVKGRTCRFVVRNNLKGDKVRILFANENCKKPVRIGGAVLEKTNESGISCEWKLPLTFSGKKEAVLKQGDTCFCDDISVAVAPGEYLALRVFFPGKSVSGSVIGHYATRSIPGNHCGENSFPTDTTVPLLYRMTKLPYEAPIQLFKSLEVDTNEKVCVISTFGDSITAGATWSDPLMKQLYAAYPGRVACGNTGLAGNRLLKDSPNAIGNLFGAAGIHRFENDVLSVAGISHVIFALGTNDIGYPGNIEKKAPMPTVEDFLQAYGALIKRCKERDIRTIYMPIFPRGDGYQSPALEALRQELNDILPKSGLFDYCIDVEDVLRNPDGVGCRTEYVNDDKLHLNAAGGEAVARMIDIQKLLGGKLA